MNFSAVNFQNFISALVIVSSGLLTACGGGGGGGGGGDPVPEPDPNTDPLVTITVPSACSPCNVGETVSLQATATDAEDGDLTSSILWSTNREEGELAQGGSLSVDFLSVKTHTITAEVTDSDGKRIFVNTVIQIINDEPVIVANVADNRTEVIAGNTVTLQATASDTEDGDISSAVVWDSIEVEDDGSETLLENLGTGASLEVTFELADIGQRTIRATVTDDNDASAEAPQFEIDVLAQPESLYIKASNTEGLGATCIFGAIDDGGTPDDVNDDVVGNGCDNFGFAVAISQDGLTLAVGAPFDDGGADGLDNSQQDYGAVYVYRDNAGTWEFDEYLRAPGPSDLFGSALALSDNGSVLAVTGSGAAYVYLNDGTAWSAGASVEAEVFDKRLPASIALDSDGDVLAVGSPRDEVVYLYTLTADVASPRLELIASNQEIGNDVAGEYDGDQFGTAVALDAAGDTLIVGASHEGSASASEADNTAEGAGAAYIFERTVDVWNQTKYLKATNIQANSIFGDAVAISAAGTRVAIGAPLENIDGPEPTAECYPNCTGDEGAAYVFALGADWELASRAEVAAQNRDAGDRFGIAVALTSDGQTLFVGARGEDSEGQNKNATQIDDFFASGLPESFYNEANPGAVYEFDVSEALGAQQNYYKAFNSAEGDKFGRSLAINANGVVLAVGANLEDGSGTGVAADLNNITGLQSGAVYLFR